MGQQAPNSETTLCQHEQEILDTALLESDQLLVRSLHDDETRRKRRLCLSILLVGGAVMFLFILAIVFGAFNLAMPEAAEAKGKRATREAIEQAEALAAEGWQLWQNQKLLAAVEKFEKSVELNPKAENAWNGYGWALFNSGQSTKALRAFEKCIKLSPKHPAGLNGLGQIYLSLGEYKQAERYLKKSAKNPHASAAWWGLTRVYLLTDEYKKALPWAKKVAAASPKNENAQKMLEAAKAGEMSDELRQMLEPVVVAKEDEDESSEEVTEEEERENSQSKSVNDKQWQKRLLAVKEDANWSVGAKLGMELVKIPGDRPYKILAENWSEIATSAKKQILKGFTPGMMGNKEMHSRFYDVMHLGMTDSDKGVRQYAAAYIEMQGQPNFENDQEGYLRWREELK